MRIRRLLLFLASVALGVGLIALMVHIGKIDVRQTLKQLEHLTAINFIVLVMLNSLLVYLSTVKWRIVDQALRHSSDVVPSRIAAFFITSAGMALGLILPVQVGMAVARTIGTHTYGRALKRGTAGTVFEQGFDLMVVFFLALASWFTWVSGRGGVVWLLSAVLMVIVAVLAVRPAISLAQWTFRFAASRSESTNNQPAPKEMKPQHVVKKVLANSVRGFANLQHSGLIKVPLARRLVLLSAARFGVICLMSNQTALAIGGRIELWRMAAAMPFVSITNVIGITPGGIGVNELTSVSVLHLFGIPLKVASEWALANRFIATGSYFVVAMCAFLLLWAEKNWMQRAPATVENL